MDNVVQGQQKSFAAEESWLTPVMQSLPILADISRADILVFRRQNDNQVQVIAQARPHSVSPVHQEDLAGRVFDADAYPSVQRVFRNGRSLTGERHLSDHRTHVIQEIFPIRADNGDVTGVLSLEKSLIEHERHRRRHPNFQRMLHTLIHTALRQGLPGVKNLSPFADHDGLVVVDAKGRILYMSGLATKLYRKLGYTDNLVGKQLTDLDTAEAQLAQRALQEGICLEEETAEGEYFWVRKAIPLVGSSWNLPFLHNKWPLGWGNARTVGVLITLHDNTRARRVAQEKAVRAAMIQEIHHRVKNNLQTIASLLRMQVRRVDEPHVKEILNESVNRILSVAVVHEFLSQHEGQIINVKEVANRIAGQFAQSPLNPGNHISVRVEGTSVFLSARQATSCALVINELLQNALEHAFDVGQSGTILVALEDEGDMLRIVVQDDGQGLGEDFDLNKNSNLGLQIVRTLVEEDLQGEFVFRSEHGVRASARVAKTIQEGKY